MAMKPLLEVDGDANAAYVTLEHGDVVRTRRLDDNRLLDLGLEGEVIGIEFLNVNHGVDLRELPRQNELVRLFEQHHIPRLGEEA